MKFCKTCAYKLDVVNEDKIEICPNCHNKTLVPTAENATFKRTDQLNNLDGENDE